LSALRLEAQRGCCVDSTISLLIGAAEQGDVAAANALFGALYSELHRLAKRELARPGAAVSLGATTLLHEAYLDMAARDGPSFPDRARFMGYAARVMRGLIIDHARERHAQKRGGLFEITSLDTNAMENTADHRELAQVLLRLLIRGNCRHAGRIGTHGATELGEGAHLSASDNSSEVVALRKSCPR
jgi:RNA polymerase sigma factor (TIGR02999 family)